MFEFENDSKWFNHTKCKSNIAVLFKTCDMETFGTKVRISVFLRCFWTSEHMFTSTLREFVDRLNLENFVKIKMKTL